MVTRWWVNSMGPNEAWGYKKTGTLTDTQSAQFDIQTAKNSCDAGNLKADGGMCDKWHFTMAVAVCAPPKAVTTEMSTSDTGTNLNQSVLTAKCVTGP